MAINYVQARLLDQQDGISTLEALDELSGQSITIKVYHPTALISPLKHIESHIGYLAFEETLQSGDTNELLGINKLISLAEVLSHRSFSLADSLQLMLRLVRGLNKFHQLHLWHGNLQSANILLNPVNGQIKYLKLGESHSLTNIKVPAVSLYTAPEQIVLLKRQADHRVDFYALGAIFYLLITQLPIYDLQDPQELMYAHLTKMPKAPHKLNVEIPVVISNLIMKLLAKDPNERYQTHHGLEADLAACLEQMYEHNLAEFELGQHDHKQLYITDKMYGRDTQLFEAAQALASNSVMTGPTVIVVKGEQGSGKTTFLQSLYKSWNCDKRAYVITGQYSCVAHYTPYSAIIEAARDLIKKILSENAQILLQLKQKIIQALGIYADLLCKKLPELELIIGPQNTIELDDEANVNNKFHEIMASFFEAVATTEKPLVLLLDNIHWLDNASINLLEYLLVTVQIKNLVLVAAYDSNFILRKIEDANVSLTKVNLFPLDIKQLNQWLADCLQSEPAQIENLSSVIYHFSVGNPAAACFYLQYLCDRKLITCDNGLWKLTACNEKQLPVNMVELIKSLFVRLPKSAQMLLKLITCYGQEITQEGLIAVAKRLKTSVEGLPDLLKQRLLILKKEKLALASSVLRNIVVQNTSTTESQQFHLIIGRYLISSMQPFEWEQLFYGLGHLGESKALISSKREKLNFIKNALVAGLKAKFMAAYELAITYLKLSASLIGEYTWKEHYQLCFDIYKSYGICAYFMGEIEESSTFFNTALSYAQTELDKVELYVIQVAQYMSKFQHTEAQLVSAKALALCGINLPETDEEIVTAIQAEQSKINDALKNKAIKDLVRAPEMIDELKSISMQILFRRAVLCYVTGNLNLFVLCVLTGTNLSLEYGKVDLSASMYAWYGSYLSGQGKYAEAYEFGELAINLANEYEHCREKSQVYNITAIFIFNFRKHIRESLSLLRQGYQIGFDMGDLQPAVYNLGNAMVQMLAKGDNLALCLHQAQQAKKLADKYKVFSASDIASMYIFAIRGLMQPENLAELDQTRFNDEQWQRIFTSNSLAFLLHLKMQQKFWINDYAGTLAIIEESEATLSMIANYIMSADHYFYYAITLLQLNINNNKVADCLIKLENWAENCPENFLHKLLLVKAEQARLKQDVIAALDLYDNAIAAAKEHEFTHIEALANELAAKFWLERSKFEFFRLYLTNALAVYERWGAGVKVKVLENIYTQSSTDGLKPAKANTFLHAIPAAIHDSQELFLLHQMRQLAQLTCAQKVSFLQVTKANRLTVVSLFDVNSEAQMLYGMPVELCQSIAAMVVNYVHRTEQPLLIDNALTDEQFGSDTYIDENKIKSIFCLPIRFENKLKGLLYLENNLLTHAFTMDNYFVLEKKAKEFLAAWQKYDIKLSNINATGGVKNVEDVVYSLRSKYQNIIGSSDDVVNGSQAEKVGLMDALGKRIINQGK